MRVNYENLMKNRIKSIRQNISIIKRFIKGDTNEQSIGTQANEINTNLDEIEWMYEQIIIFSKELGTRRDEGKSVINEFLEALCINLNKDNQK